MLHGNGKHPSALVHQPVQHAQKRRPVAVTQRALSPVLEKISTAFQYFLGGAFGISVHMASLYAPFDHMGCGHHFPLRIKPFFFFPRKTASDVIDRKSAFFRHMNERHLRRVAKPSFSGRNSVIAENTAQQKMRLSVFLPFRILPELIRKKTGKFFPFHHFSVQIAFRNRHPVLRQRTGLVRADDVHRAQRLHRRQFPHDRSGPHHPRYAERKYDRNDGRKPFRYCRHCQRHGGQKHLAHIPLLPDGNHKQQGAYRNGQNAEYFSQLSELDLQRRQLFPRFVEHIRNMPDAGIHPDRRHDPLAPSPRHIS